MHCYGASASIIASTSYRSDGAYNYYGLGTNATNAILVAPQGESSGMWSQGAKDHTFFSDMLALFKDTLCIDTTRVFSCGFSYGAMFTYSLSLEFQSDLRAVACMAPANYVIYLPTNTHKPIAYYQTTGTTDGTCPWINSTANREGGKYCLIDRLVDNGCASDTANIKLATVSGSHVVDTFCTGKYPVQFGSFVGGHTANNSDNGSSTNWIQTEMWNFFKKF
jgi:poly(3-hydroxybutyrate) depolymerase